MKENQNSTKWQKLFVAMIPVVILMATVLLARGPARAASPDAAKAKGVDCGAKTPPFREK